MHTLRISTVSKLARKAAAPILVGLLSFGGMTATAAANDAAKVDSVVGTWFVKAPDAPFTHHMFVFNADGTMQQANPDAGNPDNSDSDGKGIWARKDGKILGKFVEVTADRKTAKFVSWGEITYEIDVAGDALTGTATARFYDENNKLLRGPFPTPLDGKRVTLP
ncbi:hypothetical protein JJB09_11360 [Rhizobium sp. KVB221]|uniref:Lipocalin-like domain-containing protein n=1 Tax=Rhizobium setariae TaxID=2801340 RepID=A0A936YQF8_9HYPH|nr:hypothetical protein [Rhizobium setariae]MBL0372626.1 hypothetical protein [Rhizobium setariae]